MKINNKIIGIIGLGYVGLPLALAFSKKFSVIGYDLNEERIDQLKKGFDITEEVDQEELLNNKNLLLESKVDALKAANIFIVTVPTPIDKYKQPDLNPLASASNLVGSIIKKDDILIFESTVYPGATEEFCVPIIEKVSGLKFNKDFYAGYSPERINPGDKQHKIEDIKKVTSGSTPVIADFIDSLYQEIIKAGTFKSTSIKVAEAAKVIENTQRDLNIALMNELAIVFDLMDINTNDVLAAAGTKWNFLKFKPGLVGGHCIGVDPYYLTYKAQSLDYQPELILAGRKINDSMHHHVVSKLLKKLKEKNMKIESLNVLIMGLTFKENCPDIRNTKVVDIVNSLKNYSMNVDVYDPRCLPKDVEQTYGFELVKDLNEYSYDVVIIAVPHDEFKQLGMRNIKKLCKSENIIFDLKSVFASHSSDIQL